MSHIIQMARVLCVLSAFVGAQAAADPAGFARTTEPQRAPDLMAAAAKPTAEPAGRSVGPWYVEASYGRLNPDNFTAIMFATANTKLADDQIAGFGFGREVADFGYGFSLELGFAFNYRIDEGGAEYALPIAVVFDDFPWRDKLPMRLRAAIGPSYTTKISRNEQLKDKNDEGSKLLNMFNPEIEMGLPDAPEWSAFFRLQHRSGIFGLINDVTGGSTYMTVGVRRRFGVEAFE